MIGLEVQVSFIAGFDEVFVFAIGDCVVKATDFLEGLFGTTHEDTDGVGAFEKQGEIKAEINDGD